ncbi:hypothetical protein HGA92_01600 [Candidatus Gracilibacteria bacterium]|nr:hypothetical protein [Candidatus Gracilibacteria bacterium]NUJ98695.1 hypothetical protein [Candidatus Gracilibacteria bacterium]
MGNIENTNTTNLENKLGSLQEKSKAYILNYQENNTYIENTVNNNSVGYTDIFKKYLG